MMASEQNPQVDIIFEPLPPSRYDDDSYSYSDEEELDPGDRLYRSIYGDDQYGDDSDAERRYKKFRACYEAGAYDYY